jgi:ATP-dependent Clp protease, protease subunit
MTFAASKSDKPETDKPEGAPAEAKLLFDARYVMVFGEINDKLARATCARLLALAQASSDPIKVLISSPGGHVESGDAIHDMIRFIGVPVWTVGTGWVASAGTHIFLAADKAHRVCTPNTRFMIHQPSGGAGGTASDIAIQAREIVAARKRLAQEVSTQCGQPLEKVEADMERDHWMSPEEAIAYGMTSRIVASVADLK